LRQDEAMQTGLLEKVLDGDNLRRAWKRVKANKGAPGIDGVKVEDFLEHAREHWPRIKEQIETGRYKPQAVRRVEIPKAGGGKRLLGIPTVMDRMIQQAIAQVLSPLYEAQFCEQSSGFRPGRNAHQAIEAVRREVKAGYRMAVDMDLAKFFDTVNHDLLMSLLGRDIADKGLLRLIASYLRAGVLVGEHIEPSEVGTPQGGPLSPLLANVVLHQLDVELNRRGHRFARYADDVVILVRSLRAGQRVMQSVTKYVEQRLRLRVNRAKSKVAPMRECKFLGFTVQKGQIRWHESALEDFKHRVKKLTGRSWGVDTRHRLKELRQYVGGWMQYFGKSQYYRPIPGLDEWIRRRVRAIYWKRWRKRNTKIRELIRRGVKKSDAYNHGLSGKSHWRMARSPGMQQAFNNEVLKKMGLVSVKALWKKAQGYT
jgi:RNA-directed DNA polymerase